MRSQPTDQSNGAPGNVGLFFVLTMLISWAIWIPMILFVPEDAQLPLLLLGGFGPFLSAVIVVRLKEGKTALKQWLRETFRLRIHVVWYLVGGLLLPFGIALLHHSLYLLAGGTSAFTFDQIWGVYIVSLVSTTLVGGGNEEPGWRAFATPRLMARFHPLLANLIVGILWVIWHLPLYFGNWSGNDQSLPLFFVYAVGLSIILTWLYYKSRKSILPVMLLHAATNIVFEYFPRTNTIFSSPSLDFDVFKSIAYWIVALMIILLTRGRLGYPAETTRESS